MKTKKQREVWKDIPGFEGRYSINNFGIVKSLSRIVDRSGRKCVQPEILMKQHIDVCGYYSNSLNNKGVTTIRIHRMLAILFIPNPDNKKCVNHKDGNKLNNSLDNLEWCTYSENLAHAYKHKLNNWELPCIQCDLDGNEVGRFKSQREGHRQTGICYKKISACIKGIQKTAGGFVWKNS